MARRLVALAFLIHVRVTAVPGAPRIFPQMLEELRAFRSEFGDTKVPFVRGDKLSHWLEAMRCARAAGRLPEKRAALLDAVDPAWPDDGADRSPAAREALAKLQSHAWTPNATYMAGDLDRGRCRKPDPAGPPRARRRHLVYSSVGDRSALGLWLANGARTFDLWATYFGDGDDPPWRRFADLYRRRKGGKFQNLQAIYREPGGAAALAAYDGVFVLDNDVVLDAPRIGHLFAIRRHHDLQVLQPAFEPSGKVSHELTAARPRNQLRLTNFVEMTCPLFAAKPLAAFLDEFGGLSGWGADWWFLTVVARQALGLPRGAEVKNIRLRLKGLVAVVDAVACYNPPARGEIDAFEDAGARFRAWREVKSRERIREWGEMEFGVVNLDERGRATS